MIYEMRVYEATPGKLAACGAVMLVAAMVAVRARNGLDPRLGRMCVAVAFVAVGVTLWRVFDHPAAGLDLRYGGLLALAAAAAMAAASRVAARNPSSHSKPPGGSNQ